MNGDRTLIGNERHTWVVVRPTDISQAALLAKVSVVEPTGAETYVNAMLGEQEIVCALRDRVTHAPGADIPLSLDLSKLHVFDSQTGAALFD